MNDREAENWRKIEAHLAKVGMTDSFFYQRAVAINKGEEDPLDALDKIEE